jgi:hypothetical protein
MVASMSLTRIIVWRYLGIGQFPLSGSGVISSQVESPDDSEITKN